MTKVAMRIAIDFGCQHTCEHQEHERAATQHGSRSRFEHERINDRHDASLQFRERKQLERVHDAAHGGWIAHVGSSGSRRRDAAGSIDHEFYRHHALERGIFLEAALVAEPQASELLSHDALDHFGWKTPVDGDRTRLDARRREQRRKTLADVLGEPGIWDRVSGDLLSQRFIHKERRGQDVVRIRELFVVLETFSRASRGDRVEIGNCLAWIGKKLPC